MGECILDWSKTAATNASADGAIVWAEGQAPSSVNDSFRSMMAAHAKELADTNGTLTTGGSANAYTVAANTGYASLASGIRLIVKASFTNTGASTLTLTPLGAAAFAAKAIRIFANNTGEGDVGSGQIKAGNHYILEYDSAANAAAGAWILLNPSSGGGALWASYTPTLSAFSGSVSVYNTVGTYQQIGKTVYVNIWLSIITASSPAGPLISSVPVTPRASPSQTHFIGFDSSHNKLVFCHLDSNGSLYISGYAGSVTNNGDTYPLTFNEFQNANPGTLVISGIYEAA